MTVNRIVTLTILFSILNSVGSSHAMLLQHAMQRSGTKHATQLAQKVQKRWLETENKLAVTQNVKFTKNALISNYFLGATVGSGIAVGTPIATGLIGGTLGIPFGKEAMQGGFEVFSGVGIPVGMIGGTVGAASFFGPAGLAGYSSVVALVAVYQLRNT